ncbi:amino acid ABC transporter substrate-binding protein [Aestuariispira insulae]|uniref:ABC-type amino acid transport substrate-binding protein n=1 Tax=Aestuariispira insulae TaxID=1461337 RepID=A0A3D9H8P9_9PROT|nr:amino acid ABC transporter substrate-binding protein [Aestuariispira insulae]RED45849.1 hypothetical protein DFP90_11197 [Aestuariispira insulae]
MMRGQNLITSISLILGLFWALPLAAEPLQVIYGTRMGGEVRNGYPIQLLELALKKSGRAYDLLAYDLPITQARAFLELEKKRSITVHYAGTSADLESRFLPVRIPVYRGLLGYRVFIIHPDNQLLFSRIDSLEKLAGLRAGQGTGWADIGILEHSGLIVMAAPYESLLKMIELKRIDYFPRGINEAHPEVAQHQNRFPRLAVEKELLLVYPFAQFYFVNRDNQALHDAIRTGLVRAYEDGSFMALFNQHPHVKDMMAKVRLAERRRFDIPNPLMTRETLSIPADYWHEPLKLF